MLVEIEELEAMASTDGWRVFFRNIISEHRKHLIKQMNQCIERHEDRRIGEIYNRIKEVEKVMGLVTERIKQLREEITKQEEQDGTNA